MDQADERGENSEEQRPRRSEKFSQEEIEYLQEALRSSENRLRAPYSSRQTHDSNLRYEHEPPEASGQPEISHHPLVLSGSGDHTVGNLNSLPQLRQPFCLSVGTNAQLPTHLQRVQQHHIQNSVRTHHFRNSNCGDYHQQGNDETNLSRTNIYVRGLPKEFTDLDLNRLCQSVGRIRSLKAIMDKDTNRCKGYGFVDFETAESASAALRKINQHTNYHAQMAKQQEQDPTNLYFANLSSDVNEVTLEEVLGEYGTVISARILRDNNARSKGVGFARMENKEICDLIIDALNGKQEDRLGEREVLVKFADGSKKPKHHMSTNYLQANSHNSMNRFSNAAFGQVAANIFQQHGGSAFYPNNLQANAAELLGSTFAAAALAAATSAPANPLQTGLQPFQQQQFEYLNNGTFCGAPNGYYRNPPAATNGLSALQTFGAYNPAAIAAAASNQQVFLINPSQLGLPAVNESAQLTEIIPSGIDESHSPSANCIIQQQHPQQHMAGLSVGGGDISLNSELAPFLNNNHKTILPTPSTAATAYLLASAAAAGSQQQQQQLASAIAQMNICNQPLQAGLPSSGNNQSALFSNNAIQQIQANPQNQFATAINSNGIAQAYATAAIYQQLAAAATANLYQQQTPSIQQLLNTAAVGCNTNNPAFMTTNPAQQLGVNCNGQIGPSGYLSMSPNGGPSAFILSYLPPNPTIDENPQNRNMFSNTFGHLNGYPPSTFLPQSGHHPWSANNNTGLYIPPVNAQTQHPNIVSSNNSSPDNNRSNECADSQAADNNIRNRTDPNSLSSTSPDESSGATISRTKTSSEVSESSNATIDEEQKRRSSCGTENTSGSRWSSEDNVQGQRSSKESHSPNADVNAAFAETGMANEDYSASAKSAAVNTAANSRK